MAKMCADCGSVIIDGDCLNECAWTNALLAKLARLEKAYAVLKAELIKHRQELWTEQGDYCGGDPHDAKDALTKAEAILGGKDDA